MGDDATGRPRHVFAGVGEAVASTPVGRFHRCVDRHDKRGAAKGAPLIFVAAWIAYAIFPEAVIDRMPRKPGIEGDAVDQALFALARLRVLDVECETMAALPDRALGGKKELPGSAATGEDGAQARR